MRRARTAVISLQGAQDVADFIARSLDTACPTPNRESWEGVMNALYALTNDTDAIITDDDRNIRTFRVEEIA